MGLNLVDNCDDHILLGNLDDLWNSSIDLRLRFADLVKLCRSDWEEIFSALFCVTACNHLDRFDGHFFLHMRIAAYLQQLASVSLRKQICKL